MADLGQAIGLRIDEGPHACLARSARPSGRPRRGIQAVSVPVPGVASLPAEETLDNEDPPARQHEMLVQGRWRNLLRQLESHLLWQ